MRRLDIKQASRPLSEYADEAHEEPIIVMRGRKPRAVLLPVESEDFESVSLSFNRKFLEIIERSRRRHETEGGLSTDEVRRALGLVDGAPRDGAIPAGKGPVELPRLRIEDPLELLRWKLGLSPSGQLLAGEDLKFIPYEAFDGLRQRDKDRIDLEDLYATTAMNSRAGAGAALSLARLLRDARRRQEVNDALAAIDETADAELVDRAAAQRILRLLLGEPELKYLGVSTVFKILCRKRPRLFPMWDRLVEKYAMAATTGELQGMGDARSADDRVERAWKAIEWIGARVRKNKSAERVASQLNQDLAEMGAGRVPITPLRAIENLIWLAMSPRWWAARYWPCEPWKPRWEPRGLWGPGLTWKHFGNEWREFYKEKRFGGEVEACWNEDDR